MKVRPLSTGAAYAWMDGCMHVSPPWRLVAIHQLPVAQQHIGYVPDAHDPYSPLAQLECCRRLATACHIRMHMYMYIPIQMHIQVCMHVCVDTCPARASSATCYGLSYTHACAPACVCACVDACTCHHSMPGAPLIHAHMYTYMRVCAYVHACMCMYACLCTCRHSMAGVPLIHLA